MEDLKTPQPPPSLRKMPVAKKANVASKAVKKPIVTKRTPVKK